MTYRIEITADTLVELAGKALSLAAQLNTTAAVAAINPIMPEVAAAAPKAKVVPKAKAVVEAAPEPVAEPVVEEAPAEVPVEPEAPVEAEVAKETPAAEIDFHAEVTPRVVKVVAKCGKPAMAAILEQFGVAKASHLDAAQLPELIAAMDDAIAGVE